MKNVARRTKTTSEKPAAQVRIVRHANGTGLTELDRELLALANEVEHFITAARVHVAENRPEHRKRVYVRALTRMRLAAHDVVPQKGATHKDARMRFADGVHFYGTAAKNAPHAAGDGELHRAKALANRVASFYPELAARLTSPACVELIRVAIVARSKRSTMPWKKIEAAWLQVEKGETSRWAVDWSEHRAQKLTFRP